jgi:hypothetical protein
VGAPRGGLRALLLGALVPLLGGCQSGTMTVVSRNGNRPSPWLELRYGGGPGAFPGADAALRLYPDGRAEAEVNVAREVSGPIGLFASELSSERMAEVREAVERADLHRMRDAYPPRHGHYDYTWVEINVRSASSEKRVYTTSASWFSPRRLRPLLDLRDRVPETGAPRGILSEVISEVIRSPLAAIRVEAEVPKRTFRVNEPIPVALVISNVGRDPVAVLAPGPCPDATGWYSVALDRIMTGDTYRADIASALVDIGPTPGTQRRLGVTSQQPELVRIGPGRAWRLEMPQPLYAPTPGSYRVRGSMMAIADTQQSRGRPRLILGHVSAKSVSIAVE